VNSKPFPVRCIYQQRSKCKLIHFCCPRTSYTTIRERSACRFLQTAITWRRSPFRGFQGLRVPAESSLAGPNRELPNSRSSTIFALPSLLTISAPSSQHHGTKPLQSIRPTPAPLLGARCRLGVTLLLARLPHVVLQFAPPREGASLPRRVFASWLRVRTAQCIDSWTNHCDEHEDGRDPRKKRRMRLLHALQVFKADAKLSSVRAWRKGLHEGGDTKRNS
jgi:hypothetical protein